MSSHELARQLLENPDLPILVHTVNGFEEVQYIEIESPSLELIIRDDWTDAKYDMLKSENESPSIILISDSFLIA